MAFHYGMDQAPRPQWVSAQVFPTLSSATGRLGFRGEHRTARVERSRDISQVSVDSAEGARRVMSFLGEPTLQIINGFNLYGEGIKGRAKLLISK